jgi:hypothetical protein
VPLLVDTAFPPSCLDHIVGQGSTLTLGIDLGTTTGKTSNPTALALIEAPTLAHQKHLRLPARFKNARRDVLDAVILRLLHLIDQRGLRLRCLELDATNERLTATDIAADPRIGGKVVVRMAVLGTTRTVFGEKVTLKTYICGLVKSHLEDRRLTLPPEEWVKKDFRQTTMNRGTYESAVAADGSHADLFIATGLALDALDQDGHIEATAVPITSYIATPRPTNPTEEDENEDAGWIARTLARLGF